MTEAVLGARPSGGVELRQANIGRLSLALGDLELRYARFDGVELIRRLFVAVRDVDWGTAPAVVEDLKVEVGKDVVQSFMTALCQDPEHGIELRWVGRLRCAADGVIDFSLQATPLRSFRFGRIGLCVLHPPEFAGGRYEARTPDGWIEGVLDETIAPQLPGEHGFGEPLFPAFTELSLRRLDGIGVHFQLSGDLFEFEDQRNWGDASFKTYSTPLHLGPQLAEPGQAIQQSVAITPIMSLTRTHRRRADPEPTVDLVAESSSAVPELGVVLAEDHERQHGVDQLLRELQATHVRVDLALDDANWSRHLHSAAATAERLGVATELAITLAADAGPLDAMTTLLHELQLPIIRVLAFRRGSTITAPGDVVAVRRCLAGIGISVPVYGGTDFLFADLNSNRPRVDELDGIAFPLVPTVHADDDLSLVETASVFGDIIRTARTFTGALPLAVTPISLRERPRTDERQSSLLAAVWTLGAVSGLAQAGAESMTLFESAGPRGLLTSTEAGVTAYPVYHTVADLCSWRSYPIISARVSDPLSVACLAVKTPTGAAAALANTRPRPNRVRIRGLVADGELRARRLNDETLETAGSTPIVFRDTHEDLHSDRIELAPYELVRLGAAA
jgi:hypothetical protein